MKTTNNAFERDNASSYDLSVTYGSGRKMKAVLVVIIAMLISYESVAADLKQDAANLVLNALQGKSVPYFVETDPISADRLGYFLSRADQVLKENHGLHQDNIYLASPRITQIDVSNEYIEFWDRKKTKGIFETYIARVEYRVIGNINTTDRLNQLSSAFSGKVYPYLTSNSIYTSYCTIYDSPIREYYYWIMAKDPGDKKIKLAGGFPLGGFPDNSINFVSLTNFLNGTRRYPLEEYQDFRRDIAAKFGDVN